MGKYLRIKGSNISAKSICEFWSDKIEFHEDECWACGYYTKKSLERCHIIPHSVGGEDHPRNLVLMCSSCHLESPDTAYPDIFWDWFYERRENWLSGIPYITIFKETKALIEEYGLPIFNEVFTRTMQEKREIFIYQPGRRRGSMCVDLIKVIELRCKNYGAAPIQLALPI